MSTNNIQFVFAMSMPIAQLAPSIFRLLIDEYGTIFDM